MDCEPLFKIEDVNSIIKLFAYSIQYRFEEMDGLPRPTSTTYNLYLQEDGMDESDHLIRKYRNYTTTDEKEVKYLEKFVVRILQILEFFKQRSKNQNILTLAIKKFQEKINRIVKTVPVDVEHLYSTIIDLARNGFHIRKPPHPVRDKRQSARKIQVSDPKLTEIPSKQLSKEQELEEARTLSIANTCLARQKRQVSFSAKRVFKPLPKQNLEVQLSKLYSVMDIDTFQLQRSIQNKGKQKMQKQCFKQNVTISTAIQAYEKQHWLSSKKKIRTDTTLKQVKNGSITRPVLNNWISRKRKTTDYRKKPVDSENMLVS